MAKRKQAAKSVQIGADVEPELRDQFVEYAESMHISESALVTLVIAREIRLKRLAALPLVAAAKKTSPRTRLTGRQSTPSMREEFEVHLRSLEISRPAAITTLARTELQERWLWRSLEARGESI